MAVRSWPSNRTCPETARRNCSTARPRVDLPQPDFSDQAKRLAARYLQAYVGHRVHGLAAHRILNDEVLHLEKRIAPGLPGLLHHAQTPAVTWIG